jgi:hypothetical protein
MWRRSRPRTVSGGAGDRGHSARAGSGIVLAFDGSVRWVLDEAVAPRAVADLVVLDANPLVAKARRLAR